MLTLLATCDILIAPKTIGVKINPIEVIGRLLLAAMNLIHGTHQGINLIIRRIYSAPWDIDILKFKSIGGIHG